jgi:hypothetical protein
MPRLNWAGRLLLGVAFVAGLALFVYAGATVGMLVGVERGAEQLNATPVKGVGMAQDLSGLVNGVVAFGVATIVGTGIGLLAGLGRMWAGRRFLLTPLLRRVSALTRHSTRTHLP